MGQLGKKWLAGALGAGSLLVCAPLAADVRDGVDAWSRGDYAGAIAEWEGPAAAGDADAMFNLAQAYRLGRGVPNDIAKAEELYARAAQAGHVQAADTYGLMLFQDGRRQQALPLVQAASRRGDPRAQYLMGIAHFNGDLVPRDWQRAYALLTLANAEGLPQAASAITQMDQYIPLEQRQQGAQLARQLQAEAETARSVELAQADLGSIPGRLPETINAGSASPRVPRPAQTSVPAAAQPAVQTASARVPRPIETTAISPSVAAARDAVDQAREATGLESPAEAGASYASATRPAAAPVAQAAPRISSAPAPRSTPAPAPVTQPAQTTGLWRVQLGAFSVRANAERLWNRLSNRSEIAGRQRLLVSAGNIVRLQAGGYATRAQAQSACQSLKNSGTDCLVTR